MPFTEKLQQALNQQVNHELHSAYIYLAMAAHLDGLGLEGCEHWMRMQAHEELLHAMKLHDYLRDRDGHSPFKDVAAPPSEWESPLGVFEAALKHEKLMSDRFDNLTDLAQQERDHATVSLLRWYVDEQVEEEATLNTIISQLKLVGKDTSGLFVIDRELAGRPVPTVAGTGG